MIARHLLFTIGLGIILTSPTAHAAPTVWARALDPSMDERMALVAQADEVLRRYDRLRYEQMSKQGQDIERLGPLYFREAKKLLERAQAATSHDPSVRLRYASVLQDLTEFDAAATQFESLLHMHPPAAIQVDAYRELAVCYAHLGRYQDELKAYDRAMALEPHHGPRAVLLANRAETYMVLGDITKAVEGYRSAIGLLTPLQMFRYGVTSLWGLAVALDRSGDLDGAFDHIKLARSYDPADRQMDGPGWFYVPSYDEAWYKALGHWAAARSAELGAARAEEYGQAITAMEEFIRLAPETDPWRELAKVRLNQCEKERDQALKRFRKAR